MRNLQCRGPAGRYCKTMMSRLGDPHAAGLSVFEVTTFATGKRRIVGIVHKTDARDVGLMLNHCPWCGANIEPVEKAERTVSR